MLTYTRHPDLDFTHFVSEGDTSIENWLETVQRYGSEGMTTRELYDLRQHTNLYTNEEVSRVLQQTMDDQGLRPPDGKTAVLVDDVAKFGISRMYELHAEVKGASSTTRVFYSLDETIEWLGQDVAECL